MRKFYVLVISYLLFITEAFSQQQIKSFDQPGTNSWSVPWGVTSINVQAWSSGAGGNAAVGGGAFAQRNNISVTPGTTHTIIVGIGAGRGSGDDGEFSRFSIVFKQAKEALTLAVIYASIKANQQNDGINVEWKVENETVTKHYEVERSADGINFTKVATVPARNRQTGTYNWLDQKPMSGYNYYRVRAVDINGLIGYTQIVKVKTEITVGSISIYPNPITNGIVNLQLTNQLPGLYGIRITNSNGQTIMSKKITHLKGSSTEKIEWDYKLAHGMYQMQITKPGGDVYIIKGIY